MDIKISDIKNELELTDPGKLDDIINKYRMDTRSGVIKLIQKFDREREKLIKEQKRTEQMKVYENKYKEYTSICGIDEVGRGPLAGPVVAAAVILPKDCNILYINDSKQLSEKKREELYDLIMEQEQERLADAMEILTREERDLIILVYYNEYTLTKVAELMRRPYGQIKRLHMKALQKLRLRME